MWKLLQREAGKQTILHLEDVVDTTSTSEVIAAFNTLGDLMRYVDRHPNLNKFLLMIKSPGGLVMQFPFNNH